MKKSIILTLLCGLCSATMTMAQEFKLTPSGYFRNHGVDVMAFDDIYPEGHQGGVCVIMHGNRIATNGDLRLEATPGQWQPVPRQLERKLDANSITTTLCYPDSSRHLTGFNPMLYPDLQLQYNVRVATSGIRPRWRFVTLHVPSSGCTATLEQVIFPSFGPNISLNSSIK